ncbi:MAG: dTDP-glucose 4,6-dehydratase [bacterium]
MTDEPPRILVTGGAGFIGSNYIHLLHSRHGDDLQLLNVDNLTYAGDKRNVKGPDQARGYRFAKLDICDTAAIDAAVADFQPDAIVHFAAESHVDRSIESGGIFVRTNVDGTFSMLEAARRHDVPRFIHISTDEVYGSRKMGSFAETDALDPSSPYSSSKAASDLLALSFFRTYGLNVSVTRCTNNYGPRQHPEKLIPKTITLAKAGKRIPIYGSGKNVRDWIFVADHNEAVEVIRAKGKAGRVYNIAAGNELSNLQVVRAILAASGRSGDAMEFVKDRPGHDWRYSLDASKMRRLGWKPRTKFADGLAATMRFYGVDARPVGKKPR